MSGWSHVFLVATLAIGAWAEDPLVSPAHWSFQPIARPHVPDLGSDNPIDALVRAKLRAEGLDFNPPASRPDLVRRMYLDVTGLLPTPEQQQAALHTAPAELADALLASPHYGERWARHWLDVVRFAESSGFETNHERPNAYPYRDYVIRAFNEDKPYDRFVFEQIAGDTVGEDAATGFLVGGAWDRVKGKDPRLNKTQRQDELADMVGTTGTAFLGLTMVCAKCHDHKFDPVSQIDYFAMQSVFAGVQHGERELRPAENGARDPQIRQLDTEIATLRRDLAALRPPSVAPSTLWIDDRDPGRTEALVERRGHGVNPDGVARGYKQDRGGVSHLPNLSGGTYSWWDNVPGRDVFAWRPAVSGPYRLWLSWGCGWGTHTRDARVLIDRDGDLATRDDQTEIARVDQQRFADGSGEVVSQPLWSGFHDAGTHRFETNQILLLRGGETGRAITADTVILQRPGAVGPRPQVRVPVSAADNEEDFAPVRARRIRFTIEATNNGIEPCIDELEVWTPDGTNVAPRGRLSSSGDYVGNPKHKLVHLNDHRFGNAYSWISDTPGSGWVQVDLPEPATISRITWARDRTGAYTDRVPTRYRIECAEGPDDEWRLIASHSNRVPEALLAAGADARPALRFAGLPEADAVRVAPLLSRLNALEAERAARKTPPRAWVGRFTQPPEPTRWLFRGDPLSPRDVVAPASIGFLGNQTPGFRLAPDAPERDRRVALANWIIAPGNPLTARVMVNRLWHYHFGTGLVATPSDFGGMGYRPTHPALLDWLAAELMDNAWSLKHIHRLILRSKTYQQSSAPRADGLARDARARWLWRFPPRRLEAEAIRDNVLRVSGQLDLRMFGPGFLLFEPNANYSRNWIPKETFAAADNRRMVYALSLRMEHDAVFGAFDCPDGGSITPSRTRSTTPIQALNLFNSSFMLDQSEHFANRVEAMAGEGRGLRERIRLAYRLAFGRDPQPDELTEAVDLAETHGLIQVCRALFNTNEFLFLP